MPNPNFVVLAKQDFSGVAQANLDGVFSNSYKQYKITFNATNSSNAYGIIRMRVGGVTNSGSNYNFGYALAAAASPSAYTATSGTGWDISPPRQNNFEQTILEIFNPFQSTSTTGYSFQGADNQTSSPIIINYIYGMNNSTSYDGFSLVPNTGTITGTITVYGYEA
jgi:hypothetical protein